MGFFIYQFNNRKNDITYMSELILDTKGVKDLIRANNLCRHLDSISCALIKGGNTNGKTIDF